MIDSGFTTDEVLTAVKNWAETKEEFDDSFINSLIDGYEKYGSLTEKQSEALGNIIEKFRIDISEHF